MLKIKKVSAIRYDNGEVEEIDETLVEDKTITININDKIFRKLSAIEDSLKEFSVGYLFNENLVNCLEDIEEIKIDGTKINIKINKKNLKNREEILCSDSGGGQRTKITEINKIKSDFKVTSGELISKIEELKNNAKVWQTTGGAHVAGIVYKDKFIVKEDVSRHVAVDKVIGAGIINGFDLKNSYVIYSGRMPADMVIKMTRVGIPLLASNAAPAYSGYEIAKKGNITLVGFIRGKRFNVYNNLERVLF